MDPERVQAFFGNKHHFPEIDKLRHIAHVGVPVDVYSGGDLAQELAYGNHYSLELSQTRGRGYIFAGSPQPVAATKRFFMLTAPP